MPSNNRVRDAFLLNSCRLVFHGSVLRIICNCQKILLPKEISTWLKITVQDLLISP